MYLVEATSAAAAELLMLMWSPLGDTVSDHESNALDLNFTFIQAPIILAPVYLAKLWF